MTAEELDDLLAGIAPVIRSYVTTAFADLQKQVAAIDAKAAVPGPGIGSLLLSADGRLVAHLTDGRTLDVGPVPVKEPVPGPAGRDADPGKVFALETELAALRSETLAKAEEWRLERAQFAEDLATVKRFGDDLSARVDMLKALPAPRDGQDGVSVTVEDVAPLIEATVQKSLATLPVPVVAPVVDVEALVASHVERAVSALPTPKDGLSVTAADVAPLIAAEVHKAVAAIPLPKDGSPGADGQSVGIEDVAQLIATEIQKAVAALPPARDGQDGAAVDPFVVEKSVETLVATRVERAVASLPAPRDGVDGKDGTSVSAEDLDALVSLHVEKAVAALPPAPAGQDGASVSLDDVRPLIVAEVQKAAALIPPGKDGQPGPAGADGKTVTVDDVTPLIVAEVQKASMLIPAGKDGQPGAAGIDGRSVTVEDIAPFVVAEVQKAVAAVPAPKDGAPGRDGVGALGALIDRAGHLVVTLSDGTAKDLGVVVGQDVDIEAVKQWIVSEVAKVPIPKDGTPGTNGRDGFGFDDLDLVSDDRGVFLRFVRGDVTKEFRLPVVVDRGVFSEGRTYGKGDGVTWGGSFWIAQDETTMKPDFTPAATKCWRLAVKEGRKGKDADPAVIEAVVNKAVAKLPRPKTQEPPKW